MVLGEALQLENTAAWNWECQAVIKIQEQNFSPCDSREKVVYSIIQVICHYMQ